MWPFNTIKELRNWIEFWKGQSETRNKIIDQMWMNMGHRDQEIADLKDSNARLADALAAAKVRAGDTYGP